MTSIAEYLKGRRRREITHAEGTARDFTTPIRFELIVKNPDGTDAYRGPVNMTMNATCTVYLTASDNDEESQ